MEELLKLLKNLRLFPVSFNRLIYKQDLITNYELKAFLKQLKDREEGSNEYQLKTNPALQFDGFEELLQYIQ